MNLFGVSIICSAIAGVAAGIRTAETAPWPTIVCFVVGLLVGVLAYAIAMAPGIVVMKFAPGKGTTQSRMSSVGGALLSAGALVSPMIAYYSAMALFSVAVPWPS